MSGHPSNDGDQAARFNERAPRVLPTAGDAGENEDGDTTQGFDAFGWR